MKIIALAVLAALAPAPTFAQEMPWGRAADWSALVFDGVQGSETRVWALAKHLETPERWVYGVEVPLYELTSAAGGQVTARLSPYRAHRYWPSQPRVVISLTNASFDPEVTAGAPVKLTVVEPTEGRAPAPASAFTWVRSLPRPEPLSREYGEKGDGDSAKRVLRRFNPLELALGAALEDVKGPRPASGSPVLHASEYGDFEALEVYAAEKRVALAAIAREMLERVREIPGGGSGSFSARETVVLVTLVRSLGLGLRLADEMKASGSEMGKFTSKWRFYLAAELDLYLERAGSLKGELGPSELDAHTRRAAAFLDGDAKAIADAQLRAQPPRRAPAEPDAPAPSPGRAPKTGDELLDER